MLREINETLYVRNYYNLLDYIDKDETLFESFKSSFRKFVDNKEEVDNANTYGEMMEIINKYELFYCTDFYDSDSDFIEEVLRNADKEYCFEYDDRDDSFTVYMLGEKYDKESKL